MVPFLNEASLPPLIIRMPPIPAKHRRPSQPGSCFKRRGFALLLLVLLISPAIHTQNPDTGSPLDLVKRMAQAEIDAAKIKQHFLYRRRERSARTHGHLWEELVVEIPEGRMHRLISIDGHPLTPTQLKAENDRIQYVVRHPDEVGRDNQGRKDDEARSRDLLAMLPKAVLFTMDGMQDGCIRVLFKPNPAYQEQSYQDRIIHSSGGLLLIHPDDARLCRLDTHLLHEVDFGFGLLGKVSPDSSFSMVREQVLPSQWKTTQMHVHVDGNILLLKSVSRQEDSEHFGFQEVPFNMTVQQSADMIRSTNF
jgi:hypothetical protein